MEASSREQNTLLSLKLEHWIWRFSNWKCITLTTKLLLFILQPHGRTHRNWNMHKCLVCLGVCCWISLHFSLNLLVAFSNSAVYVVLSKTNIISKQNLKLAFVQWTITNFNTKRKFRCSSSVESNIIQKITKKRIFS